MHATETCICVFPLSIYLPLSALPTPTLLASSAANTSLYCFSGTLCSQDRFYKTQNRWGLLILFLQLPHLGAKLTSFM